MVIAIILALVLTGMPKLLGHIHNAQTARDIYDAKLLNIAVETYYLENGDYPRLNNDPVDLDAVATQFYDLNGNPLDKALATANGENWYDIDASLLADTVKLNQSSYKFLMQNPVSKILVIDVNSTIPQRKELIKKHRMGVKTLTKTINLEDILTSDHQLQITLEDVSQIKNISINNGNVEYGLDGNLLSLTLSNGNPYRIENKTNDVAGDIEEILDITSMDLQSVPESLNRTDSKGNLITLYKSGESYVSEGSYTPEDSYEQSKTEIFTNLPIPTTIQYDRDGYSGALGNPVFRESWIVSSTYIPENTMTGYHTVTVPNGYPAPSYVNYNSGGYSGKLTSYSYLGNSRYQFVGLVTKPGYYVYDYDYKYRYKGIVTKPASDTRKYAQKYVGTGILESVDIQQPYYNFTITIEYEK